MSKSNKIERKPAGPGGRPDGSHRENVAALLGVIDYARDEARRTSSDLVAFCLDIAFEAVKSDCSKRPSSIEDLRRFLPRHVPLPVDPLEVEEHGAVN